MKILTKRLGFRDWFDKNLIYCEDTHSFVHRMFKKRKYWKTYRDAQNSAFKVIEEMKEEYEKRD